MSNIEVKVIADSVSEKENRITTFELTYPRFIHCFDEETEILCTLEEEPFPVFRKLSEVHRKEGCKVAQVDKETFDVSFVEPLEWIKSNQHNELVVFENQRINFAVTRGHRLLVGSRKSNRYKKEVVLAEDLLGEFTAKRFYKKGSLHITERLIETKKREHYELVGYFIGDGHIPLKGRNATFHFSKARKINRVRELLSSEGYDFSESQYGKNTVFRVRKAQWMEACYDEQGSKTIPDWYWNISQENFEALLVGLIDSDGRRANREFNTFSKPLIERLQALCHINDVTFNLKQYDDTYKVKFLIEDSPVVRRDKHRPKIEGYHGNVYCVTVPSGFVMVRRKGVVHVSGNCEFMTHRMFSRNAASSRAIPFERVLEQVENNPAHPEEWGINRPGMQASENLEGKEEEEALLSWKKCAREAAKQAKALNGLGLHKQIVNRVLEPFVHMRTVVTATEWGNYYHLRCHKDAQPEIRILAELMREAQNKSNPVLLRMGDWHVPYYRDGYWSLLQKEQIGIEETLAAALKISASCCAQVSYRRNDASLDKAENVYARLLGDGTGPIHASPFEHQATPMKFDNSLDHLMSYAHMRPEQLTQDEVEQEQGVTHCTLDTSYWSGNLRGWIQYRQIIKGHVVCN